MSDVTGGSSVQSSLANATPKVFSLADEKDVVVLLRHIHHSTLDPDDKNELRDAIFEFRNSSETKPSATLASLLAENGFPLSDSVHAEIVEEIPSTSEVPRAMAQFGSARPSPQFSNGVRTTIPTAPSPKPPEEVVETVPEQVDSVPPIVEPDTVPAVPEPNREPAPQATPVTPVAAAETKEVSATKLVADTAGALERIKEIKKEVNLLVGNPVNLIDVHNEVGREYMNALLDAMKKNNGGTPEQVDRAMGRLEIAFTSVKQTVGVSEDGAPDEADQSATPAELPTAQSVEPQTVPEVATIEEPSIPEPETPVAPTPEPAPPVVEEEPVLSGFASVHQTHVEDSSANSDPVSTAVPSVEKTEVISDVTPPPPPVVPPQEPLVPVPAAVEKKSPALTSGGILSVAKEKQIQNLMNAEKQQAATTDQQRNAAEVARMDPLMTPDVTNGLQQLLSEWALFKSSGIFGTGPSGLEHPLYKKLATLNMTAVVAGRFEGATPEIKRSITDYMNGWRYEEGILQEQGELFEHYLRRVIKHILEKRN